MLDTQEEHSPAENRYLRNFILDNEDVLHRVFGLQDVNRHHHLRLCTGGSVLRRIVSSPALQPSHSSRRLLLISCTQFFCLI